MSSQLGCKSHRPLDSSWSHFVVSARTILFCCCCRRDCLSLALPSRRGPTNRNLLTTSSHFHSFINNEFVKGQDGKTFESINPSTEKPIVAVHEATEKDVDHAVSVARKTFETNWRYVEPEQRGRLLVKLADLFEENLELLASIESLDNGKALGMAKVDISKSAGCLRYYGGWADKIEGKVIETNPDTFSYTKQEPVSN